MKYRHSFHAGNFADIHKHVTVLALLSALKRKDKGFAYLETHAGRGMYDLTHPRPEVLAGAVRFTGGDYQAPELQNLLRVIQDVRGTHQRPHAYPGSPVIALHELRSQDRAAFAEILPTEARVLEQEIGHRAHARVELDDGFMKLRAWLPPPERRALILIDPPYEETNRDFERVRQAVSDALQRFATGVFAAWYPIKSDQQIREWHTALAQATGLEMLVSEIWLYPRDSRVALNGSGMLIVNPPYQIADRMRLWLPELESRLDLGRGAGSSVTTLTRNS